MLLTITVSTLAPDTAHQIYALVRAFAAAAASRCGTPARSVVAFGAAVEAFPGIGFPTGSTTCASRILRRVAGLAHAANRIARHDHHIETPDLPSPRMIEILGEGTTCADPELEARWIAVRWTTPYHAIAIASSGEEAIVLMIETEHRDGDDPSDRQAAAVEVLIEAGFVDLVPAWALPDGDWVQVADDGVITAESTDYRCPGGHVAGSDEIRRRHGRVLADLAATHFSTLGGVERYPSERESAHHGEIEIAAGGRRVIFSVFGALWTVSAAEVLDLRDRLAAE